MKRAKIFYKDRPAGIRTAHDAGYTFRYLSDYLAEKDAHAVSLTLPLRPAPDESPVLFPFFDALIPDGWLLDIALKEADVSVLDRMSLLLLCCKDCIGAVRVEEMEGKEVEDE